MVLPHAISRKHGPGDADPDSDSTGEHSRPSQDGPGAGSFSIVRTKIGQPQHMAWAVERDDGGRGFGFTGGHFHRNWGDDNFRKLFLNALLWVAKADVPADGVESQVSPDDLKENLDPKVKK